jgi:hypothetical protein
MVWHLIRWHPFISTAACVGVSGSSCSAELLCPFLLGAHVHGLVLHSPLTGLLWALSFCCVLQCPSGITYVGLRTSLSLSVGGTCPWACLTLATDWSTLGLVLLLCPSVSKRYHVRRPVSHLAILTTVHSGWAWTICFRLPKSVFLPKNVRCNMLVFLAFSHNCALCLVTPASPCFCVSLAKTLRLLSSG